MDHPIRLFAEPVHPLPEPGEILARLPRLLRFALAGREDRLLLRLARALGLSGGASVEMEGRRLRLRALDGVDVGRWRRQLEVEGAGLQWLAQQERPLLLGGSWCDPAAGRLLQGLAAARLCVLPRERSGARRRFLLLACDLNLSAELLQALGHAAVLIREEARRQGETLDLSEASASLRRRLGRALGRVRRRMRR